MSEDLLKILPVKSGGYAWWYFDAISDDGRFALSAIFFVGSVFSPSYASRIRRGELPSADDHLGVNLAIYRVDGSGARHLTWVMSEYGKDSLDVRDGLAIGSSRVEVLPGGALKLHFRERTAPFFWVMWGLGCPVEGTVTLEPQAPPLDLHDLIDTPGRGHRWWLRMPRARVKVKFSAPEIAFEGTGYHDINTGDERLEAGFSHWSWARFHGDDSARDLVLYQLRPRQGAPRAWLVDSGKIRSAVEFSQGPSRAVGWGLTLPTSNAADGVCAVPTIVLDRSPFYARYLAELRDGDRVWARGLGEFLDLDRFGSRVIQFLLNYKTRHKSPPFLPGRG